MLDLTKKKILVTGGSGFLGSHVVLGLKKRGIPKENIFVPSSREFDLRVWENCVRVMAGQEVVFDLAAATGDLITLERSPGTTFYDNVIMGVQLIESARRAGVQKYISMGTVAEYPDTAPTPFREDDLWTDLAPPALHSYGVTGFTKKVLLMQEQAYKKEYDFDAIHLLLTGIFGPRGKDKYFMGALVKRILAAKREHKGYIELWGTGEAVRDFLYVDDAVEGILLAAERYDSAEPVNLGTGVGISIKELAGIVAKVANFKGEIRWDATKPNGTMRRISNTERAEKEFGFKARTSLETAVRETVRWYEAQKV